MDQRTPTLTRRQAQAARLLGLGLSNRAIAAQLGVSEQAVKKLVTRLFARYGVASRAALVRLLTMEEGLAARDRALTLLAAIAPFGFAVTRGPRHVLRIASASLLERLGAGALGAPLRFTENGRPSAATALLDRVFESGELFGGRTMLDGDAPVHLVVQPMKTTAGVMEGLLLFAVDVADPPR